VAKTAHELKAETLREIGILLVVFGPLDTFFAPGEQHWIGAIITAALGAVLVRAGIRMQAAE
jgi:hypothetical protein